MIHLLKGEAKKYTMKGYLLKVLQINKTKE